MNIEFTEKAINKVKEFLSKEAGKSLRIGLQGGGCSGYQYYFVLDSKEEHDWEKSGEGYSVVVNKLSLTLMDGSIIDYVDDLSGSHFDIKNPNVKHSCGCGKSVSIE